MMTIGEKKVFISFNPCRLFSMPVFWRAIFLPPFLFRLLSCKAVQSFL